MTRLQTLFDERCRGAAAAAGRLGGRLSLDSQTLLERDRPLGPAGQSVSPNGSCYLWGAADGHVAISLAREDDRAAIPAWLDDGIGGDEIGAIAVRVADMPVALLRERALMLHLPFAVLAEASPALPCLLYAGEREPVTSPANLKVLDLSSLWAGPLCGALFAEAGAQVLRWESPARRDPGVNKTPRHYHYLNDRKEMIVAPLGRDELGAALAECDVLITSARPHALERLGLVPETIFARERPLLWAAVTAHGWQGEAAMRVGFGDDCAVAGGLVDWRDGNPVFAGDALADPLTGIEAARAAFEVLAAGRSGLLDCALATTAAWIAARPTAGPDL
jgi:CoA-transferase family III